MAPSRPITDRPMRASEPASAATRSAVGRRRRRPFSSKLVVLGQLPTTRCCGRRACSTPPRTSSWRSAPRRGTGRSAPARTTSLRSTSTSSPSSSGSRAPWRCTRRSRRRCWARSRSRWSRAARPASTAAGRRRSPPSSPRSPACSTFNEVLILQSALDPFLTALALERLSAAVVQPTARAIPRSPAWPSGCSASIARTRWRRSRCWWCAGRGHRALAANGRIRVAPRRRAGAGARAGRHSQSRRRRRVAAGLLARGAELLHRQQPRRGRDVPRAAGRDAVDRRPDPGHAPRGRSGGGPSAHRLRGLRSLLRGRPCAGCAIGPPTPWRSSCARPRSTFHSSDMPLNYSYAYWSRDEPTLLRALVVGPWLLVPLRDRRVRRAARGGSSRVPDLGGVRSRLRAFPGRVLRRVPVPTAAARRVVRDVRRRPVVGGGCAGRAPDGGGLARRASRLRWPRSSPSGRSPSTRDSPTSARSGSCT